MCAVQYLCCTMSLLYGVTISSSKYCPKQTYCETTAGLIPVVPHCTIPQNWISTYMLLHHTYMYHCCTGPLVARRPALKNLYSTGHLLRNRKSDPGSISYFSKDASYINFKKTTFEFPIFLLNVRLAFILASLLLGALYCNCSMNMAVFAIIRSNCGSVGCLQHAAGRAESALGHFGPGHYAVPASGCCAPFMRCHRRL